MNCLYRGTLIACLAEFIAPYSSSPAATAGKCIRPTRARNREARGKSLSNSIAADVSKTTSFPIIWINLLEFIFNDLLNFGGIFVGHGAAMLQQRMWLLVAFNGHVDALVFLQAGQGCHR